MPMSHYPSAHMNWTETPQHQKNHWFNLFSKKCKWTPELDSKVRTTFNKRAGKRLKGIVSRVGKSGKQPKWMSEIVFDDLMAKRADPDFIARSEQALQNRSRGAEDGKIVPGHCNASISTYELVERMTQENNGVRPDPVQIFERSHTFTAPTGEKVFASQKAKSTLETYKRIVDEDEQQGVVRPVADVFYQAAGGKQKGQVYGLGQSSSMYYPMTASSGIHSTANSEYITEIGELKDRIASEDAKMDEQAKTIEMMQA